MPKCDVGGTKIFYETFGRGGFPLVLISGTGYHAGIWKPFQVPFFSKLQEVLILDHRGVGRSEKPDEPYSTRIFAKDVVGLMDQLRIEQAHLLGHSMGGRVAQWAALDNPRRVRTLILASSGSGNFTGKPDYVRGIPLETALEIGQRGFRRYFENHARSSFFFTPDFKRRDPSRYRAAVRAHTENPPPLKAYLRHVIARQMHETSDRLGEIRAPTLVIVGQQDMEAHGTGNHYEASKFLAERIPGASLVTIAGARHAEFWERAEESNAAVQAFLSSHQ